MLPQDIEARLDDLPFVAFRLFVSNGETYDVTHPVQILIGLGSVTVSLPDPGNPAGDADRAVTLSL
jgi:hypothetical protein